MNSEFVFTSESVSSGHPDKLCDQISDGLIGEYLVQDPLARAVAECAVSTSLVFISVKAQTRATVDIPYIARSIIDQNGYRIGRFSARDCTVMTSVSVGDSGPPRYDEAALDDESLDTVFSRDHVTVFGFACKHTSELMPLPIVMAHRLARRYDLLRHSDLDYLAPDGKFQVGVTFQARRPIAIHSISILASQNRSSVSESKLRSDLRDALVEPVFEERDMPLGSDTEIVINPEGRLLGGGPAVHAGLTGRKNGVDSYGEFARHSGAALSGKDPTRVDRVGAYAARHAAKNVVASGLADRCEIQLSYSIGKAQPVSVQVDTAGMGRVPDEVLRARVRDVFDFRVGAIIRDLRLRAVFGAGDHLPRRLSTYGQVGRTDLDLPWEKTDRVEDLRQAVA